MAARKWRHVPRVIGATYLAAALVGTAGVMAVGTTPEAANAPAVSPNLAPALLCRVVIRDGKLVVVDVKTGKQVSSKFCNFGVGGGTGGTTGGGGSTGATTTGATTTTTGATSTTGATTTGATTTTTAGGGT
ncbi:hypothetical protein, partial [Streptomyces sp. NPDC047061]|uniref:hypothetical protein n=1 Tax=Streptomyces sp. NPDC047061 TaxID=3154605 RepID=UPI003403306D